VYRVLTPLSIQLDNVCFVPERSQCVLVDLGAGCQFDDADMVSSQLGGGS
jgi:hypothetical protein